MDRQLIQSGKMQIPCSSNEQMTSGSSRQTFNNYNNNRYYGRMTNNFGKNGSNNNQNTNLNRFQCHHHQQNKRNRENRYGPKNNTPRLTLAKESLNLKNVIYPSSKKSNGGGKQNNSTFVKERFVQANCQFVVSGSKNSYLEHLKNPDLILPWDSIVEVILFCKDNDDGTNELCCPICLHYPTAAKITRCGHIYCWSCALHYLSLSDKKSRPCPICFHGINKSELKSVTILKKRNFNQSDHIEFNLMKIRKGSTVAVPFGYQIEDYDGDGGGGVDNNDKLLLKRFLNFKNFNPDLEMYRKIFLSTNQQKLDLIKREYAELQCELLEYEMEQMPEICFVQNALEQLNENRKKIEDEISSNSEMLFSEENLLDMLENVKLDDDDQKTLVNTTVISNDDYTYFYQSIDGQHIYLHSINIRMLKHEYQELRNCPEKIKGKLIELHRQTITEDLRKRFSHLRHLPLSCEFLIAELEFDDEQKIISQDTLNEFRTEINHRRKERKRREKAQNIRDRNIEIEINRKFYGLHPSTLLEDDFNINESDFPAYNLENQHQEELSDLAIEGGSGDVGGDSQANPGGVIPIPQKQPQNSDSELSSFSPSTSGSGFTFANMLATGKTHFDDTLRKKVPSSSSSPPKSSIKKNSDGMDEYDDDENGGENLPLNDTTLSDYFEICVKTTNNKKKKDKKKKKNLQQQQQQ